MKIELFFTLLIPGAILLPLMSYFVFLGIQVKRQEKRAKKDLTNDINPFTGNRS
ncbi:hypothetical protein [Alkalicoccus luteus]|uniref:hypothetical protein n=1 Tax=Alkalicoccus luteus TaxID=1237094 RepID=UPI0040346A07